MRDSIKYDLPLLVCEDGFIQSTSHPEKSETRLSYIFDSHGVHFDVDIGCIFDDELNSDWEISLSQKKEARKAIEYITENHISKYNHVPHSQELDFHSGNEYKSVILLVDQRSESKSVSGSKANKRTFARMLHDARTENPQSLILIKPHPEEHSGNHQGYYNYSYNAYAHTNSQNIKLLREKINPISLLKAVDTVYVVSSQMGMEALFCDKKVICYGSPFYSGWGLTEDRGFHRQRNRSRSLEEVFYVSYIRNMLCVSPQTNKPCQLQELLAYLNSEMRKL